MTRGWCGMDQPLETRGKGAFILQCITPDLPGLTPLHGCVQCIQCPLRFSSVNFHSRNRGRRTIKRILAFADFPSDSTKRPLLSERLAESYKGRSHRAESCSDTDMVRTRIEKSCSRVLNDFLLCY